MREFNGEICENRIFTKYYAALNSTVGEALFYCAFAIYTLGVVIDSSSISQVFPGPIEFFDSLVQVSVIALLLIKFIIQRAEPKAWALACVLVCIGFLTWHQSQEGWFFWVPLFIVCSEGVRIRGLALVSMSILATGVLFIILFSVFGLIPDIQAVQNGYIRHSLGFQHPNTLALFPLMICVSYSVLCFGKNPITCIIALFVCDLFNYLTAHSRTVFLLSLIQAVLMIVFYLVKDSARRKTVSIWFALLAAAVVGSSLYLMVCFNPSDPFQLKLNSILSGRFYLANGYYKMSSLTLLGNSFSGCQSLMWWEPEATRSIVIDNAWCHLILRFGILPTLLLLAAIFLLYKDKIKTGQWDAVLYGITLMICYGFTETVGIRIEFNYFLIAVGSELLYRVNIDCSDANTKILQQNP